MWFFATVTDVVLLTSSMIESWSDAWFTGAGIVLRTCFRKYCSHEFCRGFPDGDDNGDDDDDDDDDGDD